MLYIREAKGTVAEVTGKIEDAAKANKFGVMGVINLKRKMADKGVEFGPECMIVEVCNPVQAKKVLEADMSISTALGCKSGHPQADSNPCPLRQSQPFARSGICRNYNSADHQYGV